MDLSKMTDAELAAKREEFRRAKEAMHGQLLSVQAEIDARSARARIDEFLAGLPEEQAAKVRAQMAA